ncbi:uncharacterized protein LOC111397939 [Olea europaea var. sylvestris]|uniref:uncharacterized protein LOC111397939 n=1 Tax=Olea europaea var. sylvestris TaxID=158386 RepID=UPI000C1D3EB0|nr:uncharacterized protein LOC111397939 [Olea europaea var. sylvestris]
MEPKPVDTAEVGTERVHFDFEFGMSNEQPVRNSDTDYGTPMIYKAFIVKRKAIELQEGGLPMMLSMWGQIWRIQCLIFESKAVLKVAITTYSITNNREIKFKKDDASRLRVKCKGDCPWVLYATKEHDRYLIDWEAEQNMSVTALMERVKRDGLCDISAWQTYRSKEKVLEKIRGSVVEHYKLLALRDGFIRGCRRVIGVDGCFLKTEIGGQLLTAVDANNGMYPMAYAVVKVENGDNWKWFLELLKDDLHIHNSQHWIFISDKQKGLTNAIRTLFENLEHRTCVRHLYNNFSIFHKSLALKKCLWDAARATTISQ